MTRTALSGSASVDRSVASYRERGGDVWGLGGRRAPIGVVVDGHMPTNPFSTTELTGNVRVAVDGVASGVRTAGSPPT